MAQRKSMIAQLYAAHQKSKLEKHRAELKAAKDYEAAARKLQAELERDRAKKEQLAKQKQRDAQLREKAKQAAVSKAEREAAVAQKDRDRQALALAREAQRQQVGRRSGTAAARGSGSPASGRAAVRRGRIPNGGSTRPGRQFRSTVTGSPSRPKQGFTRYRRNISRVWFGCARCGTSGQPGSVELS